MASRGMQDLRGDAVMGYHGRSQDANFKQEQGPTSHDPYNDANTSARHDPPPSPADAGQRTDSQGLHLCAKPCRKSFWEQIPQDVRREFNLTERDWNEIPTYCYPGIHAIWHKVQLPPAHAKLLELSADAFIWAIQTGRMRLEGDLSHDDILDRGWNPLGLEGGEIVDSHAFLCLSLTRNDGLIEYPPYVMLCGQVDRPACTKSDIIDLLCAHSYPEADSIVQHILAIRNRPQDPQSMHLIKDLVDDLDKLGKPADLRNLPGYKMPNAFRVEAVQEWRPYYRAYNITREVATRSIEWDRVQRGLEMVPEELPATSRSRGQPDTVAHRILAELLQRCQMSEQQMALFPTLPADKGAFRQVFDPRCADEVQAYAYHFHFDAYVRMTWIEAHQAPPQPDGLEALQDRSRPEWQGRITPIAELAKRWPRRQYDDWLLNYAPAILVNALQHHSLYVEELAGLLDMYGLARPTETATALFVRTFGPQEGKSRQSLKDIWDWLVENDYEDSCELHTLPEMPGGPTFTQSDQFVAWQRAALSRVFMDNFTLTYHQAGGDMRMDKVHFPDVVVKEDGSVQTF